MKDVQEKIRKFCEENNIDSSSEARVLDAMSELGEVAKEILKSSDYGKKASEATSGLAEELGDLLFSLVTIANKFDVNLEESLEIVLKKYEKRLERGSAGSESG
jgi:NTP pyrophosphatase (non-canonical NTP hydrolase)